MSFFHPVFRFLALLLALMLPPVANAGSGGAAAADNEGAAVPSASALVAEQRRSAAGYGFGAVASTVAAMQNLAYALQLRELCANLRVSDEFVVQQLKRFSALSGRKEDCQSLLEY